MALSRDQFQDLFEGERDRTFRFLWRLTGNAADADDLLQDAFLAAWRHREQFEGRGSAAGWLLRTAWHLFLNWRRRVVRRVALAGQLAPLPSDSFLSDGSPLPGDPLPPSGGATTQAVENRESIDWLLARVQKALDDVPDAPREAFVMFRYAGLPVAEIAALTAAPPKTVETRIRRATELLAQALDGLEKHLPR